jgi:hypothetical protein
MKVVLTESQFKKILLEGYNDKVNNTLTSVGKFGLKVIVDAAKQIGFDFRFLSTYGAGIGALLVPVFEYLNDNFKGFTEEQMAGLTVMAVSLVFFEKKDLKKLLSKISDENIESEFNQVVNFTSKLKDKFTYLLKLLGMSIHRTSNIVSYSFLIPILSIVRSVVLNYGVDSAQFQMLVESLMTSTAIAVGGVALRDILIKAAEIIEKKRINQN